jgi:hypothetical protein
VLNPAVVVLLDEADIFLEERSLSDLGRNALVSVFLRVLEYYNGLRTMPTSLLAHALNCVFRRHLDSDLQPRRHLR